jgi:hypothetical protein
MLERRGIPRIQPDKPRSPSAPADAPKRDVNFRYESGGRGRKVRLVAGRVRLFSSHPKMLVTEITLYSPS